MSLSLEEKKRWLKQELGRDVTVSPVVVNGERRFMADYLNYEAPALTLATDTEDRAIEALYAYLASQTTVEVTTKE